MYQIRILHFTINPSISYETIVINRKHKLLAQDFGINGPSFNITTDAVHDSHAKDRAGSGGHDEKVNTNDNVGNSKLH